MCTIDSKDAYFLINVHQIVKNIYDLKGMVGNLFEFNVLPFGLTWPLTCLQKKNSQACCKT